MLGHLSLKPRILEPLVGTAMDLRPRTLSLVQPHPRFYSFSWICPHYFVCKLGTQSGKKKLECKLKSLTCSVRRCPEMQWGATGWMTPLCLHTWGCTIVVGVSCVSIRVLWDASLLHCWNPHFELESHVLWQLHCCEVWFIWLKKHGKFMSVRALGLVSDVILMHLFYFRENLMLCGSY